MANQFLFANFVAAELVAACKTGDTIIQINPTGAASLPSVGTNQQIALTLWDGNLPPEIVYCTNNPKTGPLTVVRAQEGTTAQAWPAGSQVKCIITAAVINQALSAFYNISSIISAQFLPLAGGTLTGPLILSRDPINQLEAVTKEYVDHLNINALPLSGGTMTGPINMNNQTIVGLPAPTIASAAANKAYVDGAQSGILAGNNTYTGNNTFKGGTAFAGVVGFSNTVGMTGNLQCNGIAQFFGPFGVSNSATFAGPNFTIGGSTATILAGPTNLQGINTFSGPITSTNINTWTAENDFTGPLTANNTITFSGPGLNCTAPATFGVLNVTTLNATNLGFTSGNITGTLTVNGLITGNAGLNITGNSFINGTNQVTTSVVLTDETVNGNLGVFGNLSANGNVLFSGPVQCNSTLLVNGATVDANLSVNGSFSANGSFTSAGALPKFTNADAILIPTGPTGTRPTGVAGYTRFNSSIPALEYFDGANWIPTGNIQIVVKVFTANGTYNPSVGLQYADVICIGGGGGGGGATGTAAGQFSVGSGGGGGGQAFALFPASSLAPGMTVTVGAGGLGSFGSSGTNGGATIFGTLTANGGQGGGVVPATAGTLAAAPTAGGSAAGGNVLNIGGDRGDPGYTIAGGMAIGGRGGCGYLGAGGGNQLVFTAGSSAGAAGLGYGAGGGGGGAGPSQGGAGGGAGAGGVVFVREYILVT